MYDIVWRQYDKHSEIFWRYAWQIMAVYKYANGMYLPTRTNKIKSISLNVFPFVKLASPGHSMSPYYDDLKS